MGAFLKIPSHIHDIVNDSTGNAFDARFFFHLNRLNNKKEAFYTTLDEVREYFPLYTRRTTFESYTKHIKFKYDKTEVMIPTRIVDMVQSFHGFTREYYLQLNAGKTSDEAFIYIMNEINAHFPNYKGFKSGESLRAYLNKTLRKDYPYRAKKPD